MSVRLKFRVTVLELENMYNRYFGLGRGVEVWRSSYGYDSVIQDVDEPVEGIVRVVSLLLEAVESNKSDANAG
jgi:hypothetical protein